MLIRLIPKVFYADIKVGLELFVGCLGFQVLYQDAAISVLGRDGAKVYLIENAELATAQILAEYPALEAEDIRQCLLVERQPIGVTPTSR